MSSSLQPHRLQHARLSCPSPPPGACSNSCPLNQWCHPTISSVIPFSFCLQSFPASGSFLMLQLFASGHQSIVASFSASVLPVNIQDWFPLGLTGLISLQSKGLSRVFSSTTVQKHQFSSILYGPTLTSIHDYWKNCSFDYTDFYMYWFFNPCPLPHSLTVHKFSTTFFNFFFLEGKAQLYLITGDCQQKQLLRIPLKPLSNEYIILQGHKVEDEYFKMTCNSIC